MSNPHYLLTWFGRTPDHYALYPLPENQRNGKDISRIGMTLPTGEVNIFEFDFSVPPQFSIPREDLESCAKQQCSTCEWGFMHAHEEDPRCDICPEPPKSQTEPCVYWEISPDAERYAAAEYYRQLHEKNYGSTRISV